MRLPHKRIKGGNWPVFECLIRVERGHPVRAVVSFRLIKGLFMGSSLLSSPMLLYHSQNICKVNTLVYSVYALIFANQAKSFVIQIFWP